MIRLKHNSVGVALCPQCGEPLTNMVLTTSPGKAVYECWKCRETIAVEDVYREVGRTVSDFDKNIVHAICEIDDRLSSLEDRPSEDKFASSTPLTRVVSLVHTIGPNMNLRSSSFSRGADLNIKHPAIAYSSVQLPIFGC